MKVNLRGKPPWRRNCVYVMHGTPRMRQCEVRTKFNARSTVSQVHVREHFHAKRRAVRTVFFSFTFLSARELHSKIKKKKKNRGRERETASHCSSLCARKRVNQSYIDGFIHLSLFGHVQQPIFSPVTPLPSPRLPNPPPPPPPISYHLSIYPGLRLPWSSYRNVVQ